MNTKLSARALLVTTMTLPATATEQDKELRQLNKQAEQQQPAANPPTCGLAEASLGTSLGQQPASQRDPNSQRALSSSPCGQMHIAGIPQRTLSRVSEEPDMRNL